MPRLFNFRGGVAVLFSAHNNKFVAGEQLEQAYHASRRNSAGVFGDLHLVNDRREVGETPDPEKWSHL